MSYKIILQIGVALMFLVFSTVASWYEGSAILENPWEWKYSAIFSELVNGPVKHANDILPIDHFVYAAKFAPAFPLLMLISGVYLISLLVYILLKRKHKMYSYFLSCIGVLFILVSGVVSDSPTIGLKIFFNLFLLIGVFLLVTALVRTFNNKKRKIENPF